MFNIVGVIWMIILMPFFLDGIIFFMDTMWGINPSDGKEGATLGLAAFHTAFNLTNVLLLIGFVPNSMVPQKPTEPTIQHIPSKASFRILREVEIPTVSNILMFPLQMKFFEPCQKLSTKIGARSDGTINRQRLRCHEDDC